jgi:drug/metabolite transporter (DMT)-like permease
LGEGLAWRKSLAIAAGFAGVVVAVDPWGHANHADWIGILACFGCVTCFSTSVVWSRALTRTETPTSIAFFSGLVNAAAGFGLMLFHSAPLTPQLTAGLVTLGLFYAVGSMCFYIAVKHISAATISHYHYTQLLSGALLSFLIWHDKPGLFIVLGGSLILASGLYIAVSNPTLVPLPEGN